MLLLLFREEKVQPALVKLALETSLPLGNLRFVLLHYFDSNIISDLTPFEIQLGSDLQTEIEKKKNEVSTESPTEAQKDS
jgi:hypothetical protein